MNLQRIPRLPKAQAQENFAPPADLRSCHQPKLVMCSPLTLIRAHQAERVHRSWQKYTGLRIKPPGIDQLAVPGSAVVRAQAGPDR